MEWLHGFMDWAILVALAFGATFAASLLEACTVLAAAVCRQLSWQTSPHDLAMLGGWVFLFLMLGVPILVVASGFAVGALPAQPY